MKNNTEFLNKNFEALTKGKTSTALTTIQQGKQKTAPTLTPKQASTGLPGALEQYIPAGYLMRPPALHDPSVKNLITAKIQTGQFRQWEKQTGLLASGMGNLVRAQDAVVDLALVGKRGELKFHQISRDIVEVLGDIERMRDEQRRLRELYPDLVMQERAAIKARTAEHLKEAELHKLEAERARFQLDQEKANHAIAQSNALFELKKREHDLRQATQLFEDERVMARETRDEQRRRAATEDEQNATIRGLENKIKEAITEETIAATKLKIAEHEAGASKVRRGSELETVQHGKRIEELRGGTPADILVADEVDAAKARSKQTAMEQARTKAQIVTQQAISGAIDPPEVEPYGGLAYITYQEKFDRYGGDHEQAFNAAVQLLVQRMLNGGITQRAAQTSYEAALKLRDRAEHIADGTIHKNYMDSLGVQ